jgi:hypothetical protein
MALYDANCPMRATAFAPVLAVEATMRALPIPSETG